MQIGIIQNKSDSTNSTVSLNKQLRTQRKPMNLNPNESNLLERKKKKKNPSLFLSLVEQQEQEINTDRVKRKMDFSFKGQVQTSMTI